MENTTLNTTICAQNAVSGGPKDAEVLGLDIDIRSHNRAAIEAHPLARRVVMIEGSSVAPDVVAKVRAKAAGKSSVLVLLDSNHTHDHVLAELEAYAQLTSIGSYCVVFDTAIEERDQFSAFLGQNNGSIPTLITHLRELAKNYGERKS